VSKIVKIGLFDTLGGTEKRVSLMPWPPLLWKKGTTQQWFEVPTLFLDIIVFYLVGKTHNLGVGFFLANTTLIKLGPHTYLQYKHDK